MTLAELISAAGDDVRFQNLDQSAISLDWSVRKGGRITFGTDMEIIPGEGTKRLGLVVWLDRETVKSVTAMQAGRKDGSSLQKGQPNG